MNQMMWVIELVETLVVLDIAGTKLHSLAHTFSRDTLCFCQISVYKFTIIFQISVFCMSFHQLTDGQILWFIFIVYFYGV